MPVAEYTWDPTTDSVLEETDGAGHVLVSYTNEPAQYGPLLSQHRDGESSYFHFDALGSTRELTDDGEDVTDTFTYDAWGKRLELITSSQSVPLLACPAVPFASQGIEDQTRCSEFPVFGAAHNNQHAVTIRTAGQASSGTRREPGWSS